MKYVKALLMKFAMVTLVLWIVLGGFFDVSFGDILTTSIILTIGAFLLGDLFILPKFGNAIATVADFGLALMGVWLLGSYLFERDFPIGTAAFLSATAIAIGEFFFHMYMKKQGIPPQSQKSKKSSQNKSSQNKSSNQKISTSQYQTEFGSDMVVKPSGKKSSLKKRGLPSLLKKKKEISTDLYKAEFGSDTVIKPDGQKSSTNKQGLASQPEKSKNITADKQQTEFGSDMSVKPAQKKSKQQSKKDQ